LETTQIRCEYGYLRNEMPHFRSGAGVVRLYGVYFA